MNAGAAGAFISGFTQSYLAAQRAQAARAQAEARAMERLSKEFWTQGLKIWNYTQAKQTGEGGVPLNKKLALNTIIGRYKPVLDQFGIQPENIPHFFDYLSGNPSLQTSLITALARGEITGAEAAAQLAEAGINPAALDNALSRLSSTSAVRQADLTYRRGQVGLQRDVFARDVLDPQTAARNNIAIERGQIGIEADQVALDRSTFARDVTDPQNFVQGEQDITRGQLQIDALRVEAENRNIPTKLVELLATNFGVSWQDATEEQRRQVLELNGRQQTWGEVPAEVRQVLIELGHNPQSFSPRAIETASRIVADRQVQKAGDSARASTIGKSEAQLDTALKSTDETVVQSWSQAFRKDNGRPPTYRDMLNAGLTIPQPEVSRDVVRRRTGIHDAVNITTRLIDTINETQEGFRGAPALTARLISNLRASATGFINMFEQISPGSTQQVDGIIGELGNSPDVFNQLTNKSEAARVLTIQLAYALARSEGLEGRAITASILRDNFIPQAAGIVNDPTVAAGRLEHVLNGAISRFNTYQKSILGPAMPNIDYVQTSAPRVAPQATPTTAPDQNTVQSELEQFRANNPDIFEEEALEAITNDPGTGAVPPQPQDSSGLADQAAQYAQQTGESIVDWYARLVAAGVKQPGRVIRFFRDRGIGKRPTNLPSIDAGGA